MKESSTTTSILGFALRGAGAGLVFIGLLVALLCQGCGSERKITADNKSNNDVVGLQKRRSIQENKRLNSYYNSLQHRNYQNTASR